MFVCEVSQREDDWLSNTLPSLWRHRVSVCRRKNQWIYVYTWVSLAVLMTEYILLQLCACKLILCCAYHVGVLCLAVKAIRCPFRVGNLTVSSLYVLLYMTTSRASWHLSMFW